MKAWLAAMSPRINDSHMVKRLIGDGFNAEDGVGDVRGVEIAVLGDQEAHEIEALGHAGHV